MATSPLVILDANQVPRTEPSVSSRWSFDTTTVSRFIAQRDVIELSYMEGGPANQLVPFIDVQELQATYDPENLGILGTDLASYLKAPSFDYNVRGSYRTYVIRLGQPTPSQLILLDNAASQVLTLTSVDTGTYTNKLSVQVASGSLVGKMLTFRFRSEMIVLDNLQNAFGIAYTGNAGTAAMTITRASDHATRLQTTLTGATDGSISLDLDLTQAALSTVQQLVSYIDGQNGYNAVIDPYGNPLLPTSELDAVAGANIRTFPALLMRYIGAGSAATIATTATTLTTTVTGATGQNLSFDLTQPAYNTLGEVVAAINAMTGVYTCTLGPNADANATTNGLFAIIAGQDIRTSTYTLGTQAGHMNYVVPAGLGSIVNAINTLVPRVTAVRRTGATTVPANLPQTFFAGGTNPVPTNQDWLNALAVIEQEDLVGALLFPVSTDPVIQDAVNAWVTSQHTDQGKSFRAFFAPPDNTSSQAAKTMALGLNSTFAAMIPQPIVAASGVTEQPPLYPTACYCGAAAGALPTQPVTRLVVRAQSLPARAKFSKTVREDLLNNGVAVLEEVKGVGVRVSLAVTTSLSQDRIDRILSESMARDVIEQRIKAYCEPLIPDWASMTFLDTVKGQVFNALTSLEEDGVITKGIDQNGKILPAWQPIQVSVQGGVCTIKVHVLIGGELDHIIVVGTIGYQLFELTLPAGA
jgi:hypothetical protein